MRFRGASVIAAAALTATLAVHAQQDQRSAPPRLAPPYVPEGPARERGLAGYAKILCSAVFVQGPPMRGGVRGLAHFDVGRRHGPLMTKYTHGDPISRYTARKASVVIRPSL